MKERDLYVMTFMSWENECDKNIRAVALCDATGFFFCAINCMRDGDMGEMDEDGVYSRVWYGDNIECYGSELDSLRPATHEEVELYMQHVSIEDAVGNIEGSDYRTNVVREVFGKYFSCVIAEDVKLPWWKRFVEWFYGL